MRSAWITGITLAAGLAAFGAADEASAQYYGRSGNGGGYRTPGAYNTVTGIYFGGGITLGTGIGGDLQEEVGPGLGGELDLGFRFNSAFALEGSLRGALHFDQQGEQFTNLNTADVALKLFALSVGRSDGYVRLGAGFYNAAPEALNETLVGLGASVGLGYDLRVANSATVGLQADAHFIQFAGDQKDNLTTLQLGPRVAWYF